MLSSDDIATLAGALCATAEILGQTISASAAKLMAEDLAIFEPADIRAALQACRRELTGRLTLASILQRIQAADGRPGKDEAWSIALSASDENETVVMTSEILQAMTAAQPILDLGDKVGARMAFISAYERLVTLARTEGIQTSWNVSLGFDPARRVTAIESAVRMQLITQQEGMQHISDLRIASITNDGLAIAGLLTGKVVQPSSKLREKLAEVRSIVTAAKARQDREKLKKDQADRVDTYLRKRQTRTAITAMQKELPNG